MGKSIGAVYCVYGACDLLGESVERIYPVVDKIIFLLNFKPWCGPPIYGALEKTFGEILFFDDPNKKFQVVVQNWSDEKDQRNAGLKILKDQGIDWCLIIDDDEFYNTGELKAVVDTLGNAEHDLYLIPQQIYWKNQFTVIEDYFDALPSIIRTNGGAYFNENRMVLVAQDRTWFIISKDSIVCHHFSYVRSDEDMLKKISTFSHAEDILKDWFAQVWVHWHEGMLNLHPTNPPSFKKAVSVMGSQYRLKV